MGEGGATNWKQVVGIRFEIISPIQNNNTGATMGVPKNIKRWDIEYQLIRTIFLYNLHVNRVISRYVVCLLPQPPPPSPSPSLFVSYLCNVGCRSFSVLCSIYHSSNKIAIVQSKMRNNVIRKHKNDINMVFVQMHILHISVRSATHLPRLGLYLLEGKSDEKQVYI